MLYYFTVCIDMSLADEGRTYFKLYFSKFVNNLLWQFSNRQVPAWSLWSSWIANGWPLLFHGELILPITLITVISQDQPCNTDSEVIFETNLLFSFKCAEKSSRKNFTAFLPRKQFFLPIDLLIVSIIHQYTWRELFN